MPGCDECDQLVDGVCVAHAESLVELQPRALPPPPLGSCVMPIVKQYAAMIEPGMRVLEIGCGSWKWLRSHCESVGAQYEGVDAVSHIYGLPTVATRVENLAQLSFPSGYFDLVLGNQTMEHWGENGCSLAWGLYQCFRVSREGGRVCLNVPIFFHGTREFMLGDIEAIEEAFAPFSSSVVLERWGTPSGPIPPYYPYPDYPPLVGRPAYVLDIQAVKDKELPTGISNRGASSGRLAQLQRYPLSYNVYRVLRRLRVVR